MAKVVKEPNLAAVATKDLVAALDNRCIAGAYLALVENKMDDGTVGYSLEVHTLQNSGGLAVLLQAATQLNVHQFFVKLNTKGVEGT